VLKDNFLFYPLSDVVLPDLTKITEKQLLAYGPLKEFLFRPLGKVEKPALPLDHARIMRPDLETLLDDYRRFNQRDFIEDFTAALERCKIVI
jgi:hypothetical protein